MKCTRKFAGFLANVLGTSSRQLDDEFIDGDSCMSVQLESMPVNPIVA